jgi:REP element-mobilizing transposase RayT
LFENHRLTKDAPAVTLYHKKFRIESARLPGWDYSNPGYYFVTVCTYDRGHLFGQILDGKMRLTEYGEIVFDEWLKSFDIRPELKRDEFILMPNHFHGIVNIQRNIIIDAVFPDVSNIPNIPNVETHGRASLQPEPEPEPEPVDLTTGIAYRSPKSVSSFMGGLKSVITKRVNELRNTPRVRVLQYRFYDHVIRNNDELNRIRRYIRNNPANWEKDTFKNNYGNTVREDPGEYEKEIWMI